MCEEVYEEQNMRKGNDSQQVTVTVEKHLHAKVAKRASSQDNETSNK